MKKDNNQLIKQSKIKNNIPKVFIKIVISIMVIILILLSIVAIFKTAKFTNSYNVYDENIIYVNDNILIHILGIAIFILVIFTIYKLTEKIPNKYLLIGVISIYSILSIVWIIVSKTPLRADQKVVEEIAKQFVDGNYGILGKGQYLYYHPLQISIVFFIELIYRIVGFSNPIVIKLLNVVFSSITIIYLYKTVGLIFKNDKIQKMFLILILGCPILILFNVYVYGNIVGLMFGIIAIYYTLMYLEKRNIKYLFITALSIILSVILKSNYQIYLIAICIIFILDLFKKFDYKTIILIVSTIIIYSLSSTGIVKLMEARANTEVSDGIPMISYIYMGIAPKVDRASGWYNIEYDVEKMYRENNFDTEKTKEYSRQGIINRIKYMSENPIYTIKFYADKVLSTWIEPSFQTIWINEPQEEYEKVKDEISENKILISIYDGKINKVLDRYLDIYNIIIYIFVAIYIIKNFKKIENKEFLMLLIFFGGFMFHILWETKSIYAIPFFVLLIPYSAAGMNEVYNLIKNIKRKEK